MSDDIIDLDDSEYEIVESESRGPITSEEVKRKLNSDDPCLGPIEQDDFDEKGYTLTDYLFIDEDEFPRNIRGNKGKAKTAATTVGLYTAGGMLMGADPSVAGYTAIGVFTGYYGLALSEQDEEFSTAFSNSFDKLLE